MKCPHDHASLIIQSTEGHSGYVCSECRGAWLPREYVKAIEFLREFSYADFSESLSRTNVSNSGLQCPLRCGMLRHAALADLALQWCATCHGVWFDSGSIAKLLADHRRRTDGTAGLGHHTAAEVLGGLLFALLH